MNWKSLLATGVTTALLSGSALAQGANDCASAQAIGSGLGPFAFDNTSATTDGPSDCGTSPVRRDVWFDWTAPSSGGFVLRTCNQTTLGTRVAIYDGLTCPPTNQIACSANSCGNQTMVSFVAVAGQHYLIRLGSRQVGTSGTGTFDFIPDPCAGVPDDAFEDNDTCAAATSLGDGTYPNLHVDKLDPDYYDFDLLDGGTLQLDVLFLHGQGDIDIYLLLDDCATGVTSSTSGTSDEQIIYTNTSGCDQGLRLRVELWFPDTVSDCNDYTLVVTGEGSGGPCGPGTTYCNSSPTSTGFASLISGTGSSSIAANDLVLTANNLPAQPGIFIAGPTQDAIPFFNGTLCINPGGLQRFLDVNVPSGGVITQAVDYATSASVSGNPGPLQVVAGQTYNYQRWNRDPAAGGGAANFSNGYAVLHTP